MDNKDVIQDKVTMVENNLKMAIENLVLSNPASNIPDAIPSKGKSTSSAAKTGDCSAILPLTMTCLIVFAMKKEKKTNLKNKI